MPISEHVVRWVRKAASPTTRDAAPDVAEIMVDSTTNTLQFHAGGQQEVVDLSHTQTITGTKVFSGSTSVRGTAERTTETTDTITAAETGKTFICMATSGTQVFTLPAAATAGLRYSFVCGHASSEIHVGVVTGDNIVGKTSGAEDGTGILTTATTGLLKNTAANNIVGDHCTLVSDGSTTWYMTAVAGEWSGT